MAEIEIQIHWPPGRHLLPKVGYSGALSGFFESVDLELDLEVAYAWLVRRELARTEARAVISRQERGGCDGYHGVGHRQPADPLRRALTSAPQQGPVEVSQPTQAAASVLAHWVSMGWLELETETDRVALEGAPGRGL